jgi:hypothetical protein
MTTVLLATLRDPHVVPHDEEDIWAGLMDRISQVAYRGYHNQHTGVVIMLCMPWRPGYRLVSQLLANPWLYVIP